MCDANGLWKECVYQFLSKIFFVCVENCDSISLHYHTTLCFLGRLYKCKMSFDQVCYYEVVVIQTSEEALQLV